MEGPQEFCAAKFSDAIQILTELDGHQHFKDYDCVINMVPNANPELMNKAIRKCFETSSDHEDLDDIVKNTLRTFPQNIKDETIRHAFEQTLLQNWGVRNYVNSLDYMLNRFQDVVKNINVSLEKILEGAMKLYKNKIVSKQIIETLFEKYPTQVLTKDNILKVLDAALSTYIINKEYNVKAISDTAYAHKLISRYPHNF